MQQARIVKQNQERVEENTGHRKEYNVVIQVFLMSTPKPVTISAPYTH